MLRGMYRLLIAGLMIAGVALPVGVALAKDITVGLSWDTKDTLVQSWEDYMQAQSKTMGAAAGVNFKWVINVANNDPTQQAANIEDLINQGVDIIVARAKDDAAIGASIRAAKAANIPFVTFDRESTTVQPTAHVGGDGYEHAKLVGDAFVALLKQQGVQGKCVELLGSQVDTNAINASKGWHDATDSSGVIQTITKVPTEWNPDLFLSGTTNAFKAHPEANCLFAASDFALSAVQSALQSVGRWASAGKPGHVWLASVGLMPPAVKAMKGGYLDVSALWDSYGQAGELDTVLIDIATGKDPGCGTKGCLAGGRIATPATIDAMPNVWSKTYSDQ